MSSNRINPNNAKTSLPSATGKIGTDNVEKGSEANGPGTLVGIGSLAATQQSKSAKGNFDVNISSGARDRAQAFQKALDIAKQTPEIREDRVQALKEQIQNGSYKLDAGNIADGMLREAIRDHLAETE